MEVGNNMPPDKNRSICADGASVSTIYSAENGGVSGSTNGFFRLGRFASVLKLAVALWCKWYHRGRGSASGTEQRTCKVWSR